MVGRRCFPFGARLIFRGELLVSGRVNIKITPTISSTSSTTFEALLRKMAAKLFSEGSVPRKFSWNSENGAAICCYQKGDFIWKWKGTARHMILSPFQLILYDLWMYDKIHLKHTTSVRAERLNSLKICVIQKTHVARNSSLGLKAVCQKPKLWGEPRKKNGLPFHWILVV